MFNDVVFQEIPRSYKIPIFTRKFPSFQAHSKIDITRCTRYQRVHVGNVYYALQVHVVGIKTLGPNNKQFDLLTAFATALYNGTHQRFPDFCRMAPDWIGVHGPFDRNGGSSRYANPDCMEIQTKSAPVSSTQSVNAHIAAESTSTVCTCNVERKRKLIGVTCGTQRLAYSQRTRSPAAPVCTTYVNPTGRVESNKLYM